MSQLHFETDISADSLDSLLSNRNRRAVGVGIKSFSIDYTGVDPFSIHKSFDAKLVIYAASLGELFKLRTDPIHGEVYSYIDLALKTKPSGDDPLRTDPNVAKFMNDYTGDSSRLNFAIKAQIGIAAPTASNGS